METGVDVQRLQELIGGWYRQRPIRLYILFGSQAIDRAQASSDVVLAVWPIAPPEARTKLRWLRQLEELLKRSVSLVLVSPDLDPVLGFEIVRNGRLLYEAEPGLWLKQR